MVEGKVKVVLEVEEELNEKLEVEEVEQLVE